MELEGGGARRGRRQPVLEERPGWRRQRFSCGNRRGAESDRFPSRLQGRPVTGKVRSSIRAPPTPTMGSAPGQRCLGKRLLGGWQEMQKRASLATRWTIREGGGATGPAERPPCALLAQATLLQVTGGAVDAGLLLLVVLPPPSQATVAAVVVSSSSAPAFARGRAPAGEAATGERRGVEEWPAPYLDLSPGCRSYGPQRGRPEHNAPAAPRLCGSPGSERGITGSHLIRSAPPRHVQIPACRRTCLSESKKQRSLASLDHRIFRGP